MPQSSLESETATAPAGVAVVFVQFITDCLLALVMLVVWGRPLSAAAFFLVFGALDGTFLSATLNKFTHGGWCVSPCGCAVTIRMPKAPLKESAGSRWPSRRQCLPSRSSGTGARHDVATSCAATTSRSAICWRRSRTAPGAWFQCHQQGLSGPSSLTPIPPLCRKGAVTSADTRAGAGEQQVGLRRASLAGVRETVCRVPGIAVLHADTVFGVPPVFQHMLTNLPAIHQIVIFMTVRSHTPYLLLLPCNP